MIKYKNKNYGIINIRYKNFNAPILLDYDDYKKINKINKDWSTTKSGYVYCIHTYNNVPKRIFLHTVIMALNNMKKNKPIIHVNRIGWDNRKSNLIYETKYRTVKKKCRTIDLKIKGINAKDIPSYVWYMKENKSHGERFMVKIGNITWKTTSSKKISLKQKLEQAKNYLSKLKIEQPNLFNLYSMNGDFTKQGYKLINEYYKIIHKGGYDNINKYIPIRNTTRILKQKPKIVIPNKKKVIPEGLDITLPKYTYYNKKGYFVVKNHPKQINKKYWSTTTKKDISIENKYNELVKYLEEL